MIRLIHGADFHLDSPFSGLSPDQAARRRGEQRELLGRMAQAARERAADLVLLAGDLLDSERVFQETAQALARALGDIPCPVFLSPGNHDFWSPRSVYATLDWPENVHIFSSPQMEAVELPQLGCTVWGRAFYDSRQTDSPLAGFRAPEGKGVQIMCVHGDTAPQSEYGPLSPAEIETSGLDYLALGHIHQGSGLRRAGRTFWAYPGCPEGRGFDELGQKGVLYVELEEGRAQAQLLPLGRRQYEILPVDVTGKEPLEAVLAALPQDTSEHIYRIVLTGEGESPNLPALERELAPRFYGLTLRDQTRLPTDLWKRREEDTLTGLFLRAMWTKCQEEPEERTYQMAARFGLAALEGGEDVSL